MRARETRREHLTMPRRRVYVQSSSFRPRTNCETRVYFFVQRRVYINQVIHDSFDHCNNLNMLISYSSWPISMVMADHRVSQHDTTWECLYDCRQRAAWPTIYNFHWQPLVLGNDMNQIKPHARMSAIKFGEITFWWFGKNLEVWTGKNDTIMWWRLFRTPVCTWTSPRCASLVVW